MVGSRKTGRFVIVSVLKKLDKISSDKNAGTGTVIGEGIVIENAVIKGSGVIRIDGRFSGTIDIDGHIVLGETGVVVGDIHADSALFAGKYDGNLVINDTLHLAPSAHVVAHVETGKFIIDEDAVFNGTCNMGSAPAKYASAADDGLDAVS